MIVHPEGTVPVAEPEEEEQQQQQDDDEHQVRHTEEEGETADFAAAAALPDGSNENTERDPSPFSPSMDDASSTSSAPSP